MDIMRASRFRIAITQARSKEKLMLAACADITAELTTPPLRTAITLARSAETARQVQLSVVCADIMIMTARFRTAITPALSAVLNRSAACAEIIIIAARLRTAITSARSAETAKQVQLSAACADIGKEELSPTAITTRISARLAE